MRTFPQVLLQAYQEKPERILIHLLFDRDQERAISNRQFIQGASGYAQAFAQAGIDPGEVVVLILNHGEDLIYSFFGAILQGIIPSIMPFLTEKLEPERYRSSLTTLFEVTRPAVVVTYPEFLPEVQQAASGTTTLRQILVTDEIKPDPNPEFTQLNGFKRSPEDIVLLQHSSGTTGLQKGVALSHQAVFNQLDSLCQAINLSQNDVIVSWLPLYHDMGLIAGFILPILTQTPLVLMSPFDWVRAPYKLMQAVSDYKGTLSWLPNFAYNFCAHKIRGRDLTDIDLSSWRAVINCSEPMHWKSHEIFAEHFQPYGLKPEALATSFAMAENVFAVTQGGIVESVKVDLIDQTIFREQHLARPALDGKNSLKILSAGRPISNTRVRVVDPLGHELPDRHIGEIVLQSDCMLTGYYNRPDLTAKSFHNEWYLTGDLGYLADGELYVTGRKKELIIVGGKNIYPQDIERLAEEINGVHPGRVVAFGIFNEATGTEDVVLVAEADTTESKGRQIMADEIRRTVTRNSDIALRYVSVVDRGWLLKTSSGKIARLANRDKYLEEIHHA